MIDYATLREEIVNDPNGYGYKNADGTWKGDIDIANLLNELRSGIQIKRADISSEEIFHAIAIGDLQNNPGASQLEWFNGLIHAPFQVRLLNEDGSATPVRENIISIVRSGTATLSRLAALETRDGSRAEELFGAGSRVRHLDVAEARNL